MKTVPYTEFGKTKQVEIVVYMNNEIVESDTWDTTLWIARPEEMYGLMSTKLKNKHVRVITEDMWRRGHGAQK